jgi:hypothetical protein
VWLDRIDGTEVTTVAHNSVEFPPANYDGIGLNVSNTTFVDGARVIRFKLKALREAVLGTRQKTLVAMFFPAR